MKAQKTTQTMKPATAAKKLGIHVLAAPAEFQEGVVSRTELTALQSEPPQWLLDLRANGPHPRQVTAARLGVSIAGLARGGVAEALTTGQIEELKAQPPEWLRRERTIQAEVRREAERVKALHEQQAKVVPTRNEQQTKAVPTRSKVVPARSRARSK
jgi:Family of unknown function (DUF5997)